MKENTEKATITLVATNNGGAEGAVAIANLDNDDNELIDLYAPHCFVSTINKKVICGSSASTAYVAGAAVLVIGYAKELGVNLSPDEVKQILIESGTSIYSLNGYFAGKQIDIEKALKYLENKYGKSNKEAGML